MTLIVALLSSTLSLSHAQEWIRPGHPEREPNPTIYAAEVGGATAGTLVGLSLGWLTGFALWMSGTEETSTLLPAALVGFPAAAAGSAGGACLVGGAFHQQGRYLPTLAWSGGVALAGLGLAFAGRYIDDFDARAVGTAGLLVLAAAPTAAVIGYNRSRPRDSFSSTFAPGSVALTMARDSRGRNIPEVGIRLVTVGW